MSMNWGDETLTATGLSVHRPVWHQKHMFRIGDVDVHLRSSLDLAPFRFKPQLLEFAVAASGPDSVCFSHVFEMPPMETMDFGTVVYRQAPWILSTRGGVWLYRCVAAGDDAPFCLAVFASDYTHAWVYHKPETASWLLESEWPSIALLPTDQIWLCQLMADRQGVLLHASAVILDGVAFVFAGKSGAGKSTTVELLRRSSNFRQAQILCDDRIIVRRDADHWQVYGTWSHGSVSDVSAASAPLGGILLLEKAAENRLISLQDQSGILHALLSVLIRPLATDEWWQKSLGVLALLVRETRVYTMRFDLSGDIAHKLAKLIL